jgi:hypothetical protein
MDNGKYLTDKKGRPLMRIEMFIKLCMKYGFLNNDEALTALLSGLLPDDFPKRLKMHQLKKKMN